MYFQEDLICGHRFIAFYSQTINQQLLPTVSLLNLAESFLQSEIMTKGQHLLSGVGIYNSDVVLHCQDSLKVWKEEDRD